MKRKEKDEDGKRLVFDEPLWTASRSQSGWWGKKRAHDEVKMYEGRMKTDEGRRKKEEEGCVNGGGGCERDRREKNREGRRESTRRHIESEERETYLIIAQLFWRLTLIEQLEEFGYIRVWAARPIITVKRRTKGREEWRGEEVSALSVRKRCLWKGSWQGGRQSGRTSCEVGRRKEREEAKEETMTRDEMTSITT